MKYLVTGGCGYLGTSLVAEIERQYPGLHLIVYDNLSKGNYSFFLSNRFPNLNIEFHRGDILDTERLSRLLEGVSVVFHLAGMVTTPFADHSPHLFDQLNHWGTASLMTAAERASVKKIIFPSSASVYGYTDEVSTEDSSVNPVTAYSISKYQAEKQAQRAGSKIDAYILRVANVYGVNPAMRMDSFINRYVFEASFSGRVRVVGNGGGWTPVIHVDAAAHAIAALAQSDLSPGMYHLFEHNLTTDKVIEHIRELLSGVDIVYSAQNVASPNLRLAAPCRLLSLVGREPRSLRDGIKEIVECFKL